MRRPGSPAPPYSAPEHLEGHDVDARADLYSLGVIAYEALTQTFPVAGSTAQERAEATVSGAIEPLHPPGGTPPRLTRLVGNLLATDPDDRPSSADAVLLTLQSIREPTTRVVRDLAVLVFVIAVFVCGMAYSRKIEPLLAIETDGLVVARSMEGAGQVQQLKAARLLRLRFLFEGFEASELRAQVEQGSDIQEFPLGAVVVDGALELNAKRPEYSAFLQHLKATCLDGPVKVTFKLKGGAALGVVRLLVDDARPALKLVPEGTPEGTPEGVLHAESVIRITCEDHGTITDLTLKAFAGPADRLVVDVPIAEDTPVRAIDLFDEAQSGARPLGKVRLKISARDEAGNVAEVIRTDRLRGRAGAPAAGGEAARRRSIRRR